MQVRLVLRAHYQVSRPGIFSIIVLKCTSPTQSTYPETVAKKLLDLKPKPPKKNSFEQFIVNEESVKFAVPMAQSFGFLTQNCFWDWRGHVISALVLERTKIDDYLKLTLEEKVIFLKYYLEADGGAILELCKRLLQKKEITRDEFLKSNIIDQVFIATWEAYKKQTTDLRERVELSTNIRELKAKPYTYKTRIHKALFHLVPLVDLDLISRIEEQNEIRFLVKEQNGQCYMQNLVNELSTIEKMESRFSHCEFFDIIGKTYNLPFESYHEPLHFNSLIEELLELYKLVRSEPTQLASIPVMADIISTRFLVNRKIMIEKLQIEKALDTLKLNHPTDIHFHVDKYGKKSFVVISNKLLAANLITT